MKGFLNNVIPYNTTGEAGLCPYCQGNHVVVQEHLWETRRSLTFSCSDCGKWEHFDGGNFKKEAPQT